MRTFVRVFFEFSLKRKEKSIDSALRLRLSPRPLGEGFDDLWTAIGKHRAYQEEKGLLEARRHRRIESEIKEIVAERYGISREAQDEYSLQSQQRTALAQSEGRYDAEIAPLTSIMTVTDKETGATSEKEVTLKLDEGNRPKTTLADLQGLQPVFKNGQRIKEGKFITAGNASQLSDGAAALVLMEAKEAEKRGLKPLGAYRGMMVAACDPDEMGIGPVFAVPKLLETPKDDDALAADRHNLRLLRGLRR